MKDNGLTEVETWICSPDYFLRRLCQYYEVEVVVEHIIVEYLGVNVGNGDFL